VFISASSSSSPSLPIPPLRYRASNGPYTHTEASCNGFLYTDVVSSPLPPPLPTYRQPTVIPPIGPWDLDGWIVDGLGGDSDRWWSRHHVISYRKRKHVCNARSFGRPTCMPIAVLHAIGLQLRPNTAGFDDVRALTYYGPIFWSRNQANLRRSTRASLRTLCRPGRSQFRL